MGNYGQRATQMAAQKKKKENYLPQQLLPKLNYHITLQQYSMLRTQTGSFYRPTTAQKQRPKTSINKRTIDLYASKPLHKRIREAYQIHSVTDVNSNLKPQLLHKKSNSKIDSQQPETVCSWLDEFENAISTKKVGASYQYPASKYEQSLKLIDSKGYRRVKNMQKQEKLPQFVKEMREQLRKLHYKMDVTYKSQAKPQQ